MTDITKFKALIKANTPPSLVTTMPLSQDRKEAFNRLTQSQNTPLPTDKEGTPHN